MAEARSEAVKSPPSPPPGHAPSRCPPAPFLQSPRPPTTAAPPPPPPPPPSVIPGHAIRKGTGRLRPPPAVLVHSRAQHRRRMSPPAQPGRREDRPDSEQPQRAPGVRAGQIVRLHRREQLPVLEPSQQPIA